MLCGRGLRPGTVAASLCDAVLPTFVVFAVLACELLGNGSLENDESCGIREDLLASRSLVSSMVVVSNTLLLFSPLQIADACVVMQLKIRCRGHPR